MKQSAKNSVLYVQYYPDGIIIGSNEYVNLQDVLSLPVDVINLLKAKDLFKYPSSLVNHLNEFETLVVSY